MTDRVSPPPGWVRAARGASRPEVPPPPIPETGEARATAFPSLVLSVNAITFALARTILEEHESGRFAASASLARTVMRDPDLAGAMTQRLLALLGAPHCIEAANETQTAERYARDLAGQFRGMVTRAAEADLVRDAILLGFGLGQNVWYFHEERQEWALVLEPWPAEYVEHDADADAWYVHTRRGRVRITPGDGRWVLYAPWGERAPYLHGAVRQIAEWYLRASNAARDYGRFIELSGQGIIKAYTPSGARKTPEYANFIASLRNMGRSAVVPLPRGKELHEGYDLELEALAADLHKVFVEMLRVAGGKLRLCILGQDLTSQNNRVGTNASSETGMRVSAAVSQADAETWGDCLRAQVIVPWALYRGRPELAPFAWYDLEEERDAKAEAEAASVAADALGKWSKLLDASGRTVDVVAAAERWGVPIAAPPQSNARRLVLVSAGLRRAA